MAEGYYPLRRFSDPMPESKLFFERNNNTSSVSSSTRVNMSSLRRGLTLPLHEMAIPVYTALSREDVAVGGRLLFQHFIQEELVHEGLPEEILDVENPPPDEFGDVSSDLLLSSSSGSLAESSPALLNTPEGFKNSNFIKIGGNIREIADQFAASHERKLISDEADQIDLGHITRTRFLDMMKELFKNGIDKYCIIALFFFCSDVLIRCMKNKLHTLGSRLFFWALDFLLENVCKWVYDHGGWERVFSKIYTVLFKLSSVVALGVIITCGFVWMKKNM